MPRPYITMRTVRDVLRLRFAEGLSLRQIASSLTIPHTTVAIYAERALCANLDLDSSSPEMSEQRGLRRSKNDEHKRYKQAS